jgi:Ca2+-binding EF-hand superfamily protein
MEVLNSSEHPSALKRFSARFTEFDLWKALDINSNGVVDVEVLCRALKTFDAEVFTDDCLEEFAQSVSCTPRGSNALIEKLVELACQGRENTYITDMLQKIPELYQGELDMIARTRDRLKGIDLIKALDVDGTGTLDVVVLCRALKRFDASVFTDKCLEKLTKEINCTGQKIILERLVELACPGDATRSDIMDIFTRITEFYLEEIVDRAFSLFAHDIQSSTLESPSIYNVDTTEDSDDNCDFTRRELAISDGTRDQRCGKVKGMPPPISLEISVTVPPQTAQ